MSDKCKYIFEMTEADIDYWNMRKKGVKEVHELSVLSFLACTASNKSLCRKKNYKGKVSSRCKENTISLKYHKAITLNSPK